MSKLILPDRLKDKYKEFLKRATEEQIIQFFIQQEAEKKKRMLTEEEVTDLFLNKSVCRKCERLMLRSYDGEQGKHECPHCGYTTTDPYPLGKYIAEMHWK